MTKKQLLQVIRGALECHTHFDKPQITETDPDFKLGENAIVICDQCVERLRGALVAENFPYYD